ncbi:MAG: hypothetical protein QM503_01375 [Bacteroidota bacterium]
MAILISFLLLGELVVAQEANTYNEAIIMGNNLFAENKLSEARNYYQLALSYKSEDEYAINKISSISDEASVKLADEDNYLEFIDQADSYQKKYNYDEALVYYSKALAIIPNDAYAIGRINRIREIQEDLVTNSEEFNHLIEDGITFLNKNQFANATTSFKKARKIFPKNKYVKNFIVKTKEAQAIFIATQEAFNNEVELAAGYANEKNYDKVISHLYKANKISPDNWAVITEIKKYETIINTENDDNLDIVNSNNNQVYTDNRKITTITSSHIDNTLASNSKLDEKYRAISLAEIEQYQETLKTKIIANNINQRKNNLIVLSEIDKTDNVTDITNHNPFSTDDAPSIIIVPIDSSLIVENNTILLDISNKRLTNYNEEIINSHINIGLLAQRKYSYQISNNHKIDEQYINESLSEIENEIALLQSRINIIVDKIQKDIIKLFDIKIAKADSLLNIGMLDEALVAFRNAATIKPDDIYAQSKITELNEIITNISAEISRKYNLAITNGDKLVKMKAYDKALDSYRKAGTIKPEEKYPVKMVFKIINMMEQNMVVDIVDNNTIINSSTTKTFTFEPVNVNVRRSNYLFMKASNLSGKSYKVIISYGSNKGKNGGFVVQIPAGEEHTDYIIRVGNQYKWFADDNNWISILPENGDIEISLIRISKSD